MHSPGRGPGRASSAKRAGTIALALSVLALSVLALAAAAPAQASRLGALKRMVGGTEAAHPNALWHIVHGLCLRDMRASGNPAPCTEVNLAGRYAVVKDVERRTQYLLVPTVRVSGIESPELLAAGAPNYWQAAWTSRRWLEQQTGRPIPREDIGLAINSVDGRTQNQLHIHIDCVRPEVLSALRGQAAGIGTRWSRMRISLEGRRYRVRWIRGADLSGADPFKLLARADPVARAEMGRQTLAVIAGVRPDGSPGFFLLSDRSDDDQGVAAEQLLDHRCQVLSQ